MLEVGGDRFELGLQRLVLPPLAIDCGGESRQEHQQSNYDDRVRSCIMVQHRRAHPAQPIGQRRHTDGLEELRAREAVAQHTGAAL